MAHLAWVKHQLQSRLLSLLAGSSQEFRLEECTTSLSWEGTEEHMLLLFQVSLSGPWSKLNQTIRWYSWMKLRRSVKVTRAIQNMRYSKFWIPLKTLPSSTITLASQSTFQKLCLFALPTLWNFLHPCSIVLSWLRCRGTQDKKSSRSSKTTFSPYRSNKMVLLMKFNSKMMP